MNTCVTCKHWYRNHGSAEAIERELYGDLWPCDAIPGTKKDRSVHDLAQAHDAEDYSAHIRTRAEFGCVLWKAKT